MLAHIIHAISIRQPTEAHTGLVDMDRPDSRYWLLVNIVRPSQHKIGHSGDVPQANLLAWYVKTKIEHNKSTHPTINRNVQQECGPMPNLMVALPNIGGALCSMPQSLADAHY